MPPRPSKKTETAPEPVEAIGTHADAPAAEPAPAREVVHDTGIPIKYGEDNPELTPDEAKARLGWTEVEGADYLFRDRAGKKVVTTKNSHNRPFYPENANDLARKMLLKLWVLNWQPIVVDEFDEVQTGQHRLVGLVLAEQDRANDPDKYRELWGDGPVTIPTLLVEGAKATKAVVASQDTGRPQTFTDLVYRSDYFADLKAKDRFAHSKALEYAVKFLFKRVRGDAAAYSPGKTLEGFDDFVTHHPRLVRAVRHVMEDDSDKGISGYVSTGLASGLLYLMAASLSDGEAYHGDEHPREELLDLDAAAPNAADRTAYETACDFWSYLASTGDNEFNGVRKALGAFAEQPDGKPPTGALDANAVVNTVARAWGEFLGGSTSPKHKLVQSEYAQDAEGGWYAVGDPVLFDGIDRGNPSDEQADAEAETGFSDREPDPEKVAQVEAEKAKVKAEALAAKTGSAKGTSVLTGKAVPKADGQALDPLPSSKPKRTTPTAQTNGDGKAADKCPKAKDGKHSYLPGPGNTPGTKCANCGAARPKGDKAATAPKRGGTGK